MKTIRLSILLLSFLSFSIFLESCKPLKPEGQGITGTVTWLEGNQMPTISDGKTEPESTGPKGVKSKIRIYPLIKISDVKMENGLFVSLAENPIAEVETDENGHYSIQLRPGRYSVLTVEEEGMFGNIFDGEGNIMPVTVQENQWTLVDIQINYQAAF